MSPGILRLERNSSEMINREVLPPPLSPDWRSIVSVSVTPRNLPAKQCVGCDKYSPDILPIYYILQPPHSNNSNHIFFILWCLILRTFLFPLIWFDFVFSLQFSHFLPWQVDKKINEFYGNHLLFAISISEILAGIDRGREDLVMPIIVFHLLQVSQPNVLGTR